MKAAACLFMLGATLGLIGLIDGNRNASAQRVEEIVGNRVQVGSPGRIIVGNYEVETALEIRRPCNIIRSDAVCPKCGKGLMRMTETESGKTRLAFQDTWYLTQYVEHDCPQCAHHAYYRKGYPHIEFIPLETVEKGMADALKARLNSK